MTAEPVTVFVGPNNSGKSKVLREIESFVRHSHGQPNDKILGDVAFVPYTESEITAEVEKIQTDPQIGETVLPDHVLVSVLHTQENKGSRFQIYLPSLLTEATNAAQFGSTIGSLHSAYTLRLDGTNRLALTNSQVAGDLQGIPQNHLTRLFADDNLRSKVRKIVFDALSKYFVIDPTDIGNLRVRLADRAPTSHLEERSWDAASVEYHRSALEITHASDGVKAFVGIVSTIIAGDPKIMLIDEPEAFLHPALASKLGHAITSMVRQSKKRLFIATHSASFLMGCVQAGVSLNIVRLTYNDGIGTARILPQEKLLRLMRNPLLRSTGVLAGLFYETVVVCEADSDRAFYQEINERLIAYGDPRGISNCLFLNAQNKQTVWDIVKPLRELGIPVAAIVDIDFVKDGGRVFTKSLEATAVPKILQESMHSLRVNILNATNATGKDIKRAGGVTVLQGSEREAAEDFLNQLAGYGAFITPFGELESWLPSTNASGHGPAWLLDVFSKIGEDPSHPDYVRPFDGDVWDFIGSIKAWVSSPSRKGIPKM